VPALAGTVVINASLGNDGAHANVVEPRPGGAVGDDASTPLPLWGPCLDLVVCSPSPNLLESTSSGNAILAPRSLDTVDLGVAKLGLSGYLGMPSPPVSWRLVGGSME
jgi:hypothetical protein